MSVRLDHGMVERAAVGCVLRLPRVPHRGKLGEVRASSVGSSLELHDFRQYSPGDDLRHIDWNAVARTGELYLRVRQDEVSPRVEVLVDGSASMGVTDAKAARTREIAAWVCTLARRGGLDPVLIATGETVQKGAGPTTRALLDNLQFNGREPFDVALRRAPPLSPCGLRVVISDFLFESPPEPFSERLARGAAGLMLVQVLDEEDLDPSGGAGARLTDAESGDHLERILTPHVIDQYLARLEAHVALWQGAARRVRATWAQASAAHQLDALARKELNSLVEVA
ncbi:MAG: DUF58 domain-containing protein [Myxococcaceae bacterium]